MPRSLAESALEVLRVAQPEAKLRLSREIAADWRDGRITELGSASPPDRPARPERPFLLAPGAMPKRKAGGSAGRIALLHALAHIELNAIDLAWDILARYLGEGLPRTFADDWVTVASEEAEHHALLAQRLSRLGAAYGDLPAHDGLWQAAQDTAHDLLARLAVVPLVLEARGLDVTPAMIAKLKAAGDEESAGILEVIYRDEIGHVAIGKRWFDQVARDRGLEPKATWQNLVRQHFKGRLKPPFNQDGRLKADFPADYYGPLATN
ncbi:MAG: ferritin-like domain-containing protein [Pseudomonadota bacterium]